MTSFRIFVTGILVLWLILLTAGHAHQAIAADTLILINEVDADTNGIDVAEFVELYDGGTGNIPLDGLALVFIDGSDDSVYRAIDLSGQSTDAMGYYVVCGSPSVVDNCDLDATPDTNLLQNGADAVALYAGAAADFPVGSLITTTSLIDALVYLTSEADDPELQVLLNTGETQVDENGNGNSAGQSNQRCPDGSGGARNTNTYIQFAPTPGGENCPVIEPGICLAPATPIHDIQGSSASSIEVGNRHVVEGVVVGDFQNIVTGLGGFFLQEEVSDMDSDPLTSEGLFVQDSGFGSDVNTGEVVRVLGEVTEAFGQTQLNDITYLEVCGTDQVTPSLISLPVATLDAWEQVEGMLVTISQTLSVSDHYNLGRFGEIELSVNGRLPAPTNVVTPGTAALEQQDLNDRSRIQLDDGSLVQNPSPVPPYLGVGGTLRAGDTIPSLTGAIGYNFGAYEIHPTEIVTFTRQNFRPPVLQTKPDEIKVASLNVLNFFTTLDDGTLICGPSGGLECRGADTLEEFNRQRDKILSTLLEIDADIVGLVEIENNPNAATASLVDGLNATLGAKIYAYVNTGTIGTDAIKVAIIYKPTVVFPIWAHAILDSSVDPDFLDTYNRPSLAQTFATNDGEEFTVVVNHFKSKGSSCEAVGDPDMGDGQGNCNLTRTEAAQALVDWLGDDPTGSGDPDFLLLGDFNAYTMEDPLQILVAGGYHNLEMPVAGEWTYSYVFDGQAGALDHALASASLLGQVSNLQAWHVNADEPRALDYNDFNQPALYHADPYRASDHDPLVVLLDTSPENILYLPLISQ